MSTQAYVYDVPLSAGELFGKGILPVRRVYAENIEKVWSSGGMKKDPWVYLSESLTFMRRRPR
jgi:hypothetical protein